jgi:hypothetical protein
MSGFKILIGFLISGKDKAQENANPRRARGMSNCNRRPELYSRLRNRIRGEESAHQQWHVNQ